jgi:hypothetical protein
MTDLFTTETEVSTDAATAVKRGRGRPRLSEEQKTARQAVATGQKAAAERARLELRAEQAGLSLVAVTEYRDQELESHELCGMFSLLAGEEFDELVKDIRQNGQHEPGTMLDGKILDGRNRYYACRAANRPFRARDYAGKDPLGFVISANVKRRHLTAEQKRDVIARLLKDDPTRSDRAIARDVGVSKNTVATERVEQERRGQIDHVETRIDTAGRRQPATKPKGETVPAGPAEVRDSEERAPGAMPVIPTVLDCRAGAQLSETTTGNPSTAAAENEPVQPISVQPASTEAAVASGDSRSTAHSRDERACIEGEA